MEPLRSAELLVIEMVVAVVEAMATKADHQIPARAMVAPTQVAGHQLMEGVVVLAAHLLALVLPQADQTVAGVTETPLLNMDPARVLEVVGAAGAMVTPLPSMDLDRALEVVGVVGAMVTPLRNITAWDQAVVEEAQ